MLTVFALLGNKKSEDALIGIVTAGIIGMFILIPIVIILFICGVL